MVFYNCMNNMSDHTAIDKEYRRKVNAVVNYILKNLADDLSLARLAEVANYSPFHFQKIFTDVMGVSPKQYVIKTRLETACHFLIVQPNKPISDIAFCCGFSSPAVFSRAFRQYFNASAEYIRSLPQPDRAAWLHRHNRFLVPAFIKNHQDSESLPLDVTIKKIGDLTGICTNTTWHEQNIIQSMHDILTEAAANDLLTATSKIIGIANPHHNIYRAFVSVAHGTPVPSHFNQMDIKGGKYATFKVTGNVQTVFKHISSWFFKSWLPSSGYRLADVQGLEMFLQNPMLYDYNNIERELYIPVEPA